MFSSFCHCLNCRRGSANSAVQIVGVAKPAFKVTKGADKLTKFYLTEGSFARHFCSICGSGIYHDPEKAPFLAFFPANLNSVRQKKPELPEWAKPTLHINFENAVIPDTYKGDGLPHFKDFPAPFGGSGEMIE